MTTTQAIDIQRMPESEYSQQDDGPVYWVARDAENWPIWFFAEIGAESAEAERIFSESLVAEKKAENARALELYNGVAAHLSGWSVERSENDHGWYGPHYRYKLVDGQGHGIALDFGRYGSERGKVNISGYWPQHTGANSGGWTSPGMVREDSPSIGVALTRGHEVIAREITRRFLSEYLRIFGKIQERLAADAAYEASKGQAWARLVASKGITHPRERNGEQIGELRIAHANGSGWDYDKGYGSVRMTGEDSVQIELRSLPVETALRVINALKGGQ